MVQPDLRLGLLLHPASSLVLPDNSIDLVFQRLCLLVCGPPVDVVVLVFWVLLLKRC